MQTTFVRQWNKFSGRRASKVRDISIRHISQLIDDRLYFSLDNKAETADASTPPCSIILSPIRNQISDEENIPPSPPTMEQLMGPIESRYMDSEDSFVGGMGESDAGVWFTASSSRCDPLLYAPLLIDTIGTIKEHRHGIPFGLHTSGLVGLDILSSAEGEQLLRLLSNMEVTLGVADPISYNNSILQNMDGGNTKLFGDVCQFIATTAESGFPVEVSVFEGKHQAAASDLAIGLGAVQVNAYK